VIREIISKVIGKLGPFQFPASEINRLLNPEPDTTKEYEKLLKVYKKTGQFQEKSTQLLERFTAFFQCCGNSCIAFFIAWLFYWSVPSHSFILLLCIFLSFIGYVTHKERRKVWMMVIVDEKDRLKQLFFELRDDRKIIDKKIELVEAPKTPNFQGLNIFGFRKLLRYNPSFFKILSRYDDNIIRFVLLHEAGHIESGSLLRIENILVAIISMIIVDTAIIMIFLSGLLQLIVLIISVIIIVAILILILRLSIDSMKNNEFVADENAFRKMRGCYQIGDPYVFIEKVFEAMDSIGNDTIYKEIGNEIKENGGKILKLIMKYSGLDKGYHPTNEDRVNRLKRIAFEQNAEMEKSSVGCSTSSLI